MLIRNEPMGKSCPPGALLQCLPHANQTARSRVMTRHREEACFLIIGKLTLQQTIQRFGGFTSVLPGEPGGHTSLTPSGGLPCLQTKTKKSCQCLTCLHNDVCSYVLKNPLPKEIFSQQASLSIWKKEPQGKNKLIKQRNGDRGLRSQGRERK